MTSFTYMEAISIGWPAVQCHMVGTSGLYTDIVWDAGEALPSQSVLDQWIAANPKASPALEITKYQFRKLFTLAERIAVDNAPTNSALPAQARATLVTINKDMELSGIVQLDNPDVAAGVNFLEQIGLIAAGRAAQILSNTPPA